LKQLLTISVPIDEENGRIAGVLGIDVGGGS